MLESKIWDKESPINGVEAAKVLASLPGTIDAGTMFLVYNSEAPDRILRIEHMSIIRANGGYSSSLSDDEVMALYLEAANTPEEVVEEAVASDSELAIMDALSTIYEQNLEILNQ